MAFIENKILEITDNELRKTISDEVKKLKEKTQFGLVFEQHIPEVVPIYNSKIIVKSLVALKKGKITDLYRVKKINNDDVELRSEQDRSIISVRLDEVFGVKKFGDPIFPALIPMDYVDNDSDVTHTLIEADNFHALQLLEYVYPNKIDCIYIDPPYNTGSKDWKYNNNFVDEKDVYRHSKWLSFMKKRLNLAKHLLTDDGALIIAIDDYEVAHLIVLLEEIFPGHECNVVIVNHHPQGAGGDNISRTHEYALFLTPKGKKVLKGKREEGVAEEWSLARSGRDRRNYRFGRPNSFYAIHVDPETLEIKGVGPKLGKDDEFSTDDTEEGYKRIYPISKKDNSQRVWRYERSSMIKKIDQNLIKCTPNFSLKVIKKSNTKYRPVFSNWYGSRYNAGTHGTDLLAKIFGESADFPYPKALYTVYDALEAVLQDKKEAFVLDFFAGSGTTLNALALLNSSDGGKRKSILITNNEVSEEEGKSLEKKGLYPGHPEWDKNGICRAITFPRSKFILNGKRDNGDILEGFYSTGKTLALEKTRKVTQLGFVDGKTLNGKLKKQLVSLVGITQTKIKATTPFFVDEKNNKCILFDDTQVDLFLEEIDGKVNLTNFYIATTNSSAFRVIKEAIQESLGTYVILQDEEMPLSKGFKENLAYFKLDFLDPNEVALGKQFNKILPILWMMAGAKGNPQKLYNENERIPYLISEDGSLAILLQENKFRDFHSKVNEINNITIFIVTNSEEAFFEMKSEFSTNKVMRLYHNYLKNFEINRYWR
ncbi:site-specific DNA-methyltransferase [Chryseomicrobium palamuruense]|uniref:Site-specific DNA-methyltransferase n=1 Tax=Chryseomicrobium palamuruense TaxID=682973 RepID=A0ABV8UUL1_9BACL